MTAVRQAPPARLRFTHHLGARATDCSSVLPATDLATAMGVASATDDTAHHPSAAGDSIVGAAEQRIGTQVCFARGSGSSPDGIARITVDPGQAWAVTDLADDAAARGALRLTTLPGLAARDRALSDCAPGGTTPCTVVLAVGDDLIQIEDNPRPARIADAIVAAAR